MAWQPATSVRPAPSGIVQSARYGVPAARPPYYGVSAPLSMHYGGSIQTALPSRDSNMTTAGCYYYIYL